LQGGGWWAAESEFLAVQNAEVNIIADALDY
jgi:hypothetical protein